MSLLASWLSAAGLASLHPVFVSYGVTDQSFVELQFQDYDAMGIFEPPERQRLFKLIQQVKRQQQAQSQPVAQPANASPQQQSQPIQQPPTPTPQPAPQSQQPLPVASQPQPQFTAPPQPPKPTALPRPSVAPLQSAPQTTRRIDQLSQPRDRAIVERATSISVAPTAASFIASASPPPSHSPPLASPRASYSSKRRSGVGSFDMPAVNNQPSLPQPQQHVVPHEEHARVSRLLDDDDTGMDGDEDDDDDTINSSMAAIDLSTASASNADNPADPTNSRIRVAVRKRPINSKEKSQGQLDVATVTTPHRAVTIHEPKVKVDLTKYVESHRFCFDEVFDENGTNEEIYAATCKPLIPFFLNKGKATCFAYGQTGSGKSVNITARTRSQHVTAHSWCGVCKRDAQRRSLTLCMSALRCYCVHFLVC